jgi:hypothetical protein
MGKKREFFQHHPLPEALETHLKSFLSVPQYDFLSPVPTTDRVRNQITAEMLKLKGHHVQAFGSGSHGTDALFFRPGEDGITIIEFAEMKSCYVPDTGKSANYFEYGKISAEVCDRLAGEVQILSRFKKCNDSLDRMVDCHIIYPGSPFHEFLSRTSSTLKAGAQPVRLRFSLKQMKEMGAIKVL